MLRFAQVLALALPFAAFTFIAAAQSDMPLGADVRIPITQTVLRSGRLRYGIPVTVGATTVQAALDTGSVGLRVLSRALADSDYDNTLRADSEDFRSGTRFEGYAANAVVSLGALQGSTPLQIVTRAGCNSDNRHCTNGALPFADYHIMDDGIAGQGFDAMIGIRMGTNAIENPLNALGSHRWIVDLPRPDDDGPGALTVDPAPQTVADYVSLPTLSESAHLGGQLYDALPGCLVNDRTHERVCGAIMLDTGAPGIHVVSAAPLNIAWPAETPASLIFSDASGRVRAVEHFAIGRRTHAATLSFQVRQSVPMTIIYASTPYLAFSVYYNEITHTIGFRPKAFAPATPRGLLP